MTKSAELPPRVFAKGRWYYLVTAQGDKRVWTKLTLQRDGIPALNRKLADVAASEVAPERMPALITDWLGEVSAQRSTKSHANDRWVMIAISASFAEFRAGQVTPPDCVTFLKPYRVKPRTHNEMRAGLRELMRYAEEPGIRPAGSNPVDSIKTLATPARGSYPTDSELRRIKVAAFYGADGKRTRQGAKLAALIATWPTSPASASATCWTCAGARRPRWVRTAWSRRPTSPPRASTSSPARRPAASAPRC